MKKDLKVALGNRFAVTGTERKVEVTDNTVLDYNKERNVAQVEVRNGKLFVNVYRGYFYKPTEFVEAKNVEEVKTLIEGRFKIRAGQVSTNGQDVQ